MSARELLIDLTPHIPPGHALDQLSPDDADRRIEGMAHSIAEIVAHMCFWQEWFCRRCEGHADPMAAPASVGWPAVTPGSWPEVHQRFVAGLERAASLDSLGQEMVTPAIEFPPLSHYTVRDGIVHMAQHNSYHLGQIVQLRQMMGLWPPPAGSWTW